MSEYVNPIDNVIKDLEEKRQRIIKAYNSGEFCDNKTSKHNIEVLTKGINAMKSERRKVIYSKLIKIVKILLLLIMVIGITAFITYSAIVFGYNYMVILKKLGIKTTLICLFFGLLYYAVFLYILYKIDLFVRKKLLEDKNESNK